MSNSIRITDPPPRGLFHFCMGMPECLRCWHGTDNVTDNVKRNGAAAGYECVTTMWKLLLCIELYFVVPSRYNQLMLIRAVLTTTAAAAAAAGDKSFARHWKLPLLYTANTHAHTLSPSVSLLVCVSVHACDIEAQRVVCLCVVHSMYP